MNDLAASTLQKALAISPNNDKVKKLIKEIEQDSVLKQYEVASKKYDEGDYEGALKLYQMIKNPDASVYAGIGACYQALNKYDKAIEAYNKSISIDASEPTTYAYLASVYFSKNDLAKAEEYYLKAQKLDPSNADVKEGLKAVKMAKLSNMLEKALNLYNSKKYTEAMTLLNQVIAADSKNAYAYYYRAMVYDAQNKYELAIKDYLKAVENSTELSIAYYSLAVDYDMLNNKVEAKKAYQKFLAQSKGEENEYTKYARKRLQELK